jgi:hypothetical protein
LLVGEHRFVHQRGDIGRRRTCSAFAARKRPALISVHAANAFDAWRGSAVAGRAFRKGLA